ncbi:hypothetical protein ACFPK1_08125 [Actinomycetospora rhizophila]|uniref:Uncharacterized protein n=1 Tax=Actinomycetospora rhizophila TaxID=1416876 RepID=A0ABV9ZCY8_9PSEU
MAAYTAYIAVVETVTSEQARFLSTRWWAFGGFMALTLLAVLVAYYRKLKQARGPRQTEHPIGRWVPITELAPAILAAGAWGLALPGGPLSASLTGDQSTLTVSAIIIGGGALVALTAAPARQATNEAPPDGNDSAEASGGTAESSGQIPPSPSDPSGPSTITPEPGNGTAGRGGRRRTAVRTVEPVFVLGQYLLVRRMLD